MNKITLVVAVVLVSLFVGVSAFADIIEEGDGIAANHEQWLRRVMAPLAQDLPLEPVISDPWTPVPPAPPGIPGPEPYDPDPLYEPFYNKARLYENEKLVATEFYEFGFPELKLVMRINYIYSGSGVRFNGAVLRDYNAAGIAETKIVYSYNLDTGELLTRSKYVLCDNGAEYRLSQVNSYITLTNGERKLYRCANYNEDGTTIKNITYYSYDNEGRISGRTEETYDMGNDMPVKVVRYSFVYFGDVKKTASQEISIYDSNHNILQHTLVTCEYNDNGTHKKKDVHHIDYTDSSKSFHKIYIFDGEGNLIAESRDASSEEMQKALNVLGESVVVGSTIEGDDGIIITTFYDVGGNYLGQHRVNTNLDPGDPEYDNWYDAAGNPLKDGLHDEELKGTIEIGTPDPAIETPKAPSTAAGSELIDRLIIAQEIQKGKTSLPEGVKMASPQGLEEERRASAD